MNFYHLSKYPCAFLHSQVSFSLYHIFQNPFASPKFCSNFISFPCETFCTFTNLLSRGIDQIFFTVFIVLALFFYSTVLESGSLKSRCWKGWFFLESERESISHFSPNFWQLWKSLAFFGLWMQHTKFYIRLYSHGSRCVSACLILFCSYKDT